MPLSKKHYNMIREHFFILLGSKCSACDFNDVIKMHFHHKNGHHLINGCANNNSYQGRGRDCRAWELFIAYSENNLELKCPSCHKINSIFKHEHCKEV